jgi:pimeloyl-ACP methyl ester carboxylesterase
VYVDPAIRTPREVPWYMTFPLVGDLVYQWQSRNWASGQLSDFLHPERFPGWADRYRVQMQYKGFRRGRMSDAEANAEYDARTVLAEVGKSERPVLVLWGRQDQTAPFDRSKDLLAALPRAKFVPVDSAGHLPHWEQPAVTHGAMLAFLRGNAAAGALPTKPASSP